MPIAKRARVTTEDVLDELELANDQDDFDKALLIVYCDQ